MSLKRLVQAATTTAQHADAIGKRFARELAQVLKDTERKLRPLVADAAAGNRTAIVRAAQANRTHKGIREALTKAGYDELADAATSAPLDRMAERVLASRRLAQQSAGLTSSVESKLAALKALQLGDLLDEGDALARELWQATVRGVFGSRSVDDILADLADVLDATEPQIRTLYDTSVSIYGRQVEALQAGDDPDTPFAYMGPVDAVTRDFCLHLAGQVLTRSEIDALDNGQLDNVFLTGGGYNCRHQWIEVSKFSELRSGSRVPEVQAQLDALSDAA